MRTRRRAALVAGVLTLALGVAACDSGSSSEPTPTGPVKQVELSFGVYGSSAEVAAYRANVDAYNARTDGSDVSLRTWPDQQALIDAVRDGSDTPDVFLISRDELGGLQRDGLVQPLDSLLDERDVELGDGYSRDALEAFSADSSLQCMPYGISPMVIYYNTDLVDFARMRKRGLDVPSSPLRWTFDEFTAAAKFASRPQRRTRGASIAPTLSGLAPFIYSGGGQVYDDTEAPTSLAFSDDGTRGALQRTLEVLRDPQLTLSPAQLAKASPMTWFERGRVGMIAGYRSMVPELRKVHGLKFDIQPMPTLDSTATVGDFAGICVSSSTPNTAQAADFLVDAISTEAVSRVTRAGYLVPANQQVALSDDFLQSTRQPEHAGVFITSIRSTRIPPLVPDQAALEDAVAVSLDELVNGGPAIDLEALTARIDEESRTVLTPPTPTTPSPSPQG